jgi:hypothetical protein
MLDGTVVDGTACRGANSRASSRRPPRSAGSRRFHLHFTLTSRSWPNMVERLFRQDQPKAHLPRSI